MNVQIVHTIAEVRAAVSRARAEGKRIGFVPTLGGLHDAHGALMDRSVAETEFTVVSIFVNALQFGPSEDFNKYPRNLETDGAFCASRGVDLVFAPSQEEMYPEPQRTFVDVTHLTDGLCGPHRPGHFRGVTTVVMKLFNIVQPDVAYFGEKDAQQLAVVRRMVEDLNMPVEIRSIPTVREADGLAMSTRNQYLSAPERHAAATVYRALSKARQRLEQGERSAKAVREAIRAELSAEPSIRIQYVDVVDTKELQPVDAIEGRVLVAVAVFIGNTRLIDNLVYPS